MLFPSRQEAAKQLADLIIEEINPEKSLVCSLTQEGKVVGKTLAQQLDCEHIFLPDELGRDLSSVQYLIFADDGAVDVEEYNEFTESIRLKYPLIQTIFAIPVIAKSEEPLFKERCDRLFILHSDPYFFTADQFYET